MAKRELITREDAIKTVSRWIKTDMTLGSSLFEMMMNEIHAIPEQEIVKPYLEKLKAEIRKLDDINPQKPNGYFGFLILPFAIFCYKMPQDAVNIC